MTEADKKTTKQIRKKPLNSGQRIAIVLGLIILFLIGMFTGLVPYAAAYIGCGKAPVSTSKFAASYTYELPGEYGHGPSPFNGAYYCSQAEAEAAGYQHSPLTEGARLERAKENLEAY